MPHRGSHDPATTAGPAAPDGFDPSSFDDLRELEAGSWWFAVRNELLVWALRRHAPDARSLLEVGCGTGFVLAELAHAQAWSRLVGGELHAEGLAVARERVPSAELRRLDVRALPFDAEFDVVGAFDVLEHVDEDERALREIRRALRDGGVLLLTVPQHRWLWGPADEYAHHQRRYTRRELAGKVRAAGFRIELATSFVTALLPLMVVSRIRDRLVGATAYDPRRELEIPVALNAALRRIARCEALLLQHGLRLPAGGSLLIAARACAR